MRACEVKWGEREKLTRVLVVNIDQHRNIFIKQRLVRKVTLKRKNKTEATIFELIKLYSISLKHVLVVSY